MTTQRAVVLDVGSVRRGNVGWAAVDADANGIVVPAAGEVNAGRELESLVRLLRETVHQGMPLAVGFECPTFVPIPEDAAAINSPRCGEPRDRGFAAGAGASALVTGLVETAWVLRAIADSRERATVDVARWPYPCPILLWEAFVSKRGKSGIDVRALPAGWPPVDLGDHARDAAAAAAAFAQRGDPSGRSSDVGVCGHPFLNTVVAAALRFEVDIDAAELAQPCYVVVVRD